MNVSLAIESFQTADALAQMARDAAALGFEGLELPILPAGPLSYDTPPTTCHEWSKRIVDAGLRVSALALRREPDSHLASLDSADRRRAYERSMAAFDRAQWLGAGLVVLTPAIVGGPGEPRAQMRYEEAYTRSVESLLALRFEAQPRGIHIACDIRDTRFLLSPMEARGFIERVNSPFVGLSLDLGSLLPTGYPPDWIASLGHRVFHVYLTDRRLDQPGAPCLIGDGDVDGPATLEALKAARFDGPLTLPPTSDPREAMSRLHRLRGRTSN